MLRSPEAATRPERDGALPHALDQLEGKLSLLFPTVSSSSRPKTDGLSNRGKHSQSTDPSAVTRAAEWQSDSSACAPIGTALMPYAPTGK